MSDKPLSIHQILHMLRNPFGYSHEQMRTARNDAADELERLQGDGVDARRYRWLRDSENPANTLRRMSMIGRFTAQECDAHIDAEIASEPNPFR